jgi:S-adenosylmethionine-diacylglycerol 3-amino-3-carboxypropyl transferase
LAVDRSAAQIACLELRVAGYRRLSHHELLELLGAIPSKRRPALYASVRPELSDSCRRLWDARPRWIAEGLIGRGRFERYFRLFRTAVLPLIHSRAVINYLTQPLRREERELFYDRVWDNRRWRALFRMFFSRAVMGRLARDPRFFAYVKGGVAGRLLERARHAMVELDPLLNPYLQWIALGRFLTALPHALREDNFDLIRRNLDCLRWRVASVESALGEAGDASINRFNLSDILEYQSGEQSDRLLASVARAGRRGGRVAYWNLLVPRSRPPALASRLRPLTDLSERLLWDAGTFFYSRFVLEEIT